MKFIVRHIPTGTVTVVEEAVSDMIETEVRTFYGRSGVVVSVTRDAFPLDSLHAIRRFDVAWWCQELRTLLRSGMTVVEAIDVLATGSEHGARQQVLAELSRRLQQGLSLSRAMQSVDVFPTVLVASIAASERASTLEAALDDYLRHQSLLEGLKRQAVSSAIYPMVVASLGMLITVFLLTFVIPRFSRIYVGSSADLSAATRVVLALSGWVSEQFWAIAVGLVLAAAVLAMAYRNGSLGNALATVVQRLPMLQRQINHFRLAKLFQSLALMFRGGYTLDEALAVCRDLRLGADLERAVEKARVEMTRGRGVATALATAGLTDTVTQRMMAAGERSGHFDKALDVVAERHAMAFATFIERVTRIVEPVLLLIVALVVGSIVVLMYLPIFDLTSGLGGGR